MRVAVGLPPPKRDREAEFQAKSANPAALLAMIDELAVETTTALNSVETVDWSALEGWTRASGEVVEFTRAYALDTRRRTPEGSCGPGITHPAPVGRSQVERVGAGYLGLPMTRSTSSQRTSWSRIGSSKPRSVVSPRSVNRNPFPATSCRTTSDT